MYPYRPRRIANGMFALLFTLCASAAQDVRAQAGAARSARAAAGSRKGRAQPKAADERARALLEEGRRHADAGQWDEAVRAFRQALAIDPLYGDAYIDLGDAYMSSGNYKEGFAAYEQAINIAPRNADAHYSLGAAYNDMAMYGDAFKPFVQAIRLDPDYAEAHYGIGYAYLKLDNYRNALPYLRQAVRLKPDYAEAHLALGQTHLGLRNVKAAEAELKTLASLDALSARKLEKDIREAASAAPEAAPEAARPVAPARVEQAVEPARLKPKGAQETTAAPQQKPANPAAPQTQNAAFELSFWESIKSSTDPEEFAAYIRKYPDGQFIELARIRMRGLEAKRGGSKETEVAPHAEVATANAEGETKQLAVAINAQPAPTPTPQPTPAPTQPAPVAMPTPSIQPQPQPQPAAEQPSKPPAEQPAQVAAVQPPKETAAKEKEQPVEEKRAAAVEPLKAEEETTVEGALSLLRKLFPSKFTYTARAAGGPRTAPVTSEVNVNYEPLDFEGCQLSWHDSKDTLSVSLSDLDASAVTVAPRVRPSTTFSIEVWEVTIATEGGRGAISEEKGDGSGAVNVYNGLDLQYDTRQKAEAVATALRRAIKLCTGRL